MTDVLRLLPPLQWRGRKYPVTARNVTFAHETASHRFQYKDNEAIEQLGARNLTLSYTIPLRQDIAKGPYKHLFTEGLAVLLRDTRNREPGELVDPFYGTLICVPSSYTDDSDPNKRDGTDVRVEFMHSPDPDADQTIEIPTLQGVTTEAGALEEELQLVDWEQEPSPDGTTDPFSAVAGLGGQIDRLGEKAVATLHDYAFRAEKVENTFDRLEEPEHWHTRQAVRRNRLAALDLAERAARPDRTIVTVTTRFARTVSAVALELGMSVLELLQLNPALARSPVVPAGARVQARRRGGASANSSV